MATSAPTGFSIPDFARPLDVQATLARLPLHGAIKGMYLQNLIELCENAGRPLPPRPTYTAFKEYPLVEHVRLLLESAAVLHPEVSVREGLRRIGHSTYDVMAATLIGRVVFGVLGHDIKKITRLVAKAYDISGRGMSATLLGAGDDWSHIRLEGHDCLVDSYHVGAFEGVLRTCRVDGLVRLQHVSPTVTELFTTWHHDG